MNTQMPYSTSLTNWSQIGKTEHVVQFYQKEAVLVASVAGFFAGALRGGNSAVIIGTAAHRNAVEKELRNDDFDLAALQACGQYFSFDAAETLSKFMVKGSPDETLFKNTVGTVLTRATQKGRSVRAFGEMVALLWAEGKQDAAIRLEDLWNNLAKTYSFALFCAYPVACFAEGLNAAPFVHVCKQHTRVIPADGIAAAPALVEQRA